MIRRYIRVSGRVQGVGFRYFCQEAALSRDVRGWVRNCVDGSVELEAEAPASVLEKYLHHIRTGHPWARVDHWDSADVQARNDNSESFEIRY
ncbi:MAG: acylphosphatase [Elusimicrobia bacterium]|nr:acylphosphatase [Elusimicrobiota bacterium]